MIVLGLDTDLDLDLDPDLIAFGSVVHFPAAAFNPIGLALARKRARTSGLLVLLRAAKTPPLPPTPL